MAQEALGEFYARLTRVEMRLFALPAIRIFTPRYVDVDETKNEQIIVEYLHVPQV